MAKYFTIEGLEKLKRELEHLKNVRQREIAQQLNYAASFGDLSENAAYQQAKETQKELVSRIIELEHLLKGAKVLEKNRNSETIQIGSCILLECQGEKETLEIVIPEEADLRACKISSQSPLGKALLGKKPGEKAEIKTPEKKITYKILKIE